MIKFFEVIVLDESKQSLRIMDVYGYSHMSQIFVIRLANKNFNVRKAYIKATNKKTLTDEIKKVLGDSFWSSINFPQKHGVNND